MDTGGYLPSLGLPQPCMRPLGMPIPEVAFCLEGAGRQGYENRAWERTCQVSVWTGA